MIIKYCPHCGSTYGMYSKEYFYGEEYYRFPDGEHEGHSELSDISKRKSRPLYCIDCNKRITTLERLIEAEVE